MRHNSRSNNLPVVVIGGGFLLAASYAFYQNHKSNILENGGKIYECAGGGVVRVNGLGNEEYCNGSEDRENPAWCFEYKRIWPATAKSSMEWNPEYEEYAEFRDRLNSERVEFVPDCQGLAGSALDICLTIHAPHKSDPTLEECLNGTRTWTWNETKNGLQSVLLPAGEEPLGAK